MIQYKGENLTANYHTHTERCRHADGSDRDYIEEAIRLGFHSLGFSDHMPCVGYDDMDDRMEIKQFPEYFDTMTKLKEEYKDRIRILVGFEADYYDSHFDATWEILKQYPLDYLILGQHYTRGWREGARVFIGQTDENALKDYVDIVCRGIDTGLYSYVAHPDVFSWEGDDATYEKHMIRICEKALEYNLPLEMNSPGDCTCRHYPADRFWRMAAKTGNVCIFGADAHEPEKMASVEGFQFCVDMMQRVGIRRTETFRTLPEILAERADS